MVGAPTLEDILCDASAARDTLRQRPEQAIRQCVVDRVLGALGWELGDPMEVWPEFHLPSTGRVDYCLLLDGQPEVFIEAKPLSRSIGEGSKFLDEGESQLFGYAAQINPPFAVLTNGFLWRFYQTTARGWWPERLFRTIEVAKPIDGPASILRELLSRDAVDRGSALALAQELLASAALERQEEDIEADIGSEERVRAIKRSISVLILDGNRHDVGSSSAALVKAFDLLVEKHGEQRMESLLTRNATTKRWFKDGPEHFQVSFGQLGATGRYYNTNLSTQACIDRIRKLLDAVSTRRRTHEFSIEYADPIASTDGEGAPSVT